MKERILNVNVVIDKSVEIIKGLVSSIEQKKKIILSCINPHSVVISKNDKIFEEALIKSDINIPDGQGVVLASKLFGGNVRERVTGSDIFNGLHQALNQKDGFSAFFLGSTEETLSIIRIKMAQDFPNVKIAGTYSPPFKEEFTGKEILAILDAVNNTNPDVLWVAMTAPKQEKWIYQNRDKLNARVIAAVGAAFDFYAGTVKRSSPFWQNLGLEWLPRLFCEPRRLWRRNFISTPIFIYLVLKEKVMGPKQRA